MNLETNVAAPATKQNLPEHCWGNMPELSDFNPIPLSTAARDVATFREINGPKRGFGVIHKPAALLEYLNNHFCKIVADQPPAPEGFEWGVGHYFMTSATGKTEFCVAPILFRNEAAPNGLDTITDVFDPFDLECPYHYTYGVRGLQMRGADNTEDIYDMGEMWP
jgi:hypothetical protein